MTKTTEDTLRDLFKTGYDPVKVDVHARGINEDNLEVSIAGHKYSVKGNQIICLDKSDRHAEPVDALPEEGNTNSPQYEAASTDAGSEGSGETGDSAGEVVAPVEDEEAYREESGIA